MLYPLKVRTDPLWWVWMSAHSHTLTRCRWCVEGDLWAVGAEHGVPAAPNSEGVKTLRVQVTHDCAGPVNPLCSPPAPAVLPILLWWGQVAPPKSGNRDHNRILWSGLENAGSSCLHPPSIFKYLVICRLVVFRQPPTDWGLVVDFAIRQVDKRRVWN